MALLKRSARAAEASRSASRAKSLDELGSIAFAGVEPIRDVRWRRRVKVAGRVRAVRVQPWAEIGSLEVTLGDGTGGLTVVFLGRRQISGIGLGSKLTVEGMVTAVRGQLAIMNPDYQLLPNKVVLPFWDGTTTG